MVSQQRMIVRQCYNDSSAARAGNSEKLDRLRPRSGVRWCAADLDCSRLDLVMTVPASAMSVPMLLAELVELGRKAWRISERERAVRAQINALQEIEENQ